MPKTTKLPSKRKPNPAFMRPVQPDDKLAAVVGSKPLPRCELTKKLWDYIKKNGLQDKKKRTQINADDSLRPVFNGKSQVSMFEMTKLVSGHIRYRNRFVDPGGWGVGHGLARDGSTARHQVTRRCVPAVVARSRWLIE